MARPRREEKPDPQFHGWWREAVPSDRLAPLVKDAVRAIARALMQRLTRQQVSIGYWTFLRILWERDGITQTELSTLAGVKNPTTFAALQSMEREGYITRRKRPGNLKNKYIYLTPRGKALKDKLIPLAEEVHRVAIRGVPARDVETTRATLMAMIRNLDADHESSSAGH
jgi:DNA-binding MarR family transcriptional regulator